MASGGVRLGVDFGTSTTVAVLAYPDGRVRPLLFDGSELLPSAVCATDTGELLVGRDAWHAARAFPGGLEASPKRTVDDGVVLLSGVEYPVVALFAAVLRRVAVEARLTDGDGAVVVMTCPATWGPRRRQVLVEAAAAAGLGPVRLVAEPVAAACYLSVVGGVPMAAGAVALVYDLGAGTFDASVVRHTPAGFVVLAERGLPDAGGLDIDAAIVDHLGVGYAARDPQRWRRLTQPDTAGDRRAARQLWDDVRTAKEMLSRTAATMIHVPLFDEDAPLGRAELERLARPILDRTVHKTEAALRDAGVRADDVAGLFMVGGGSRLPLAATLLHRGLGLPPVVMERPEFAVAEGSLYTSADAGLVLAPLAGPAPIPEPETPQMAAEPALVTAPVRQARARLPLRPRRPTAIRRSPTGQTSTRRLPGRRVAEGWPGYVAAVVVAMLTLMTVAADQGPDDVVPGIAAPLSSHPGTGTGAASPTPLPARTIAPTSVLTSQIEQNTVAFSRDGTLLLTGGGLVRPRVWQLSSGTWIDTVGTDDNNFPTFTDDLTVSPDGNLIATTSIRDARLWNARTRKHITVFKGHTDRVTALAFSPDSRLLATAGSDSTVRIWDVGTRTTVGALNWYTGSVNSVAFNRDGTLLATSRGVTVQLWNVGSWANVATFNHSDVVTRVAFSPRDNILAASDDGGTVRNWDLGTGRVSTVFDADAGPVRALAFSPDGATMATAHDDHTARLWDVTTGRNTTVLVGHTAAVSDVIFSPDGSTLATVSMDYTARLWRSSA